MSAVTRLARAVVIALIVGLAAGTTPAAAVSAPQGLTVLENGATPTFTWDRVGKATAYQVAADDNPDFSSPVFFVTTANNAYAHSRRLPRGQVYWRVRAVHGGDQSSWAESTLTVGATTPPTLLAPINGEGVTPPVDPPVLKWDVVAGAASYRVEVAVNDTFTSPKAWTTRSTSFLVPNAQGMGTYYWRVRAEFDGGLVTDWSAPASYEVTELPLVEPADAIAPGHLETVQDVVLHWTPVTGAQSYEVQVATDRNFNEIVDNRKGVVSTRYSPPVTYRNNDYFWRVRAVNSAGEPTRWAATPMEFRRRWSASPSLVHPANGVSAAAGDPFFFEWTPVRHAMRYRLEVGTDPNFSPGTFESCYTAQTTYAAGYLRPGDRCMPLSQGGVYHWRVLAVEPGLGGEIPSIYSQIRSFIYDAGPVQLQSPAEGATVDVPTLTWRAHRDAERYRLQVRNATGQIVQDVTTHALSWTSTTKLDPAKNPYSWSVTALDSNNSRSPNYGWRSFSVSGAVPDDPDVPALTPLTDGATSTRFPTLAWEPHPEASYYRIDIGVADTGYWLDSGTTPVLNRNHPYPALTDDRAYFLDPGTYEWRIRAYDGSNNLLETGTEHATFTITDLAPVTGQAIALTGTASQDPTRRCDKALGATVGEEQICSGVPTTPVLTWDPVPEAALYMVYLAEDRDLTQLVYGNSSTNNGIPTTSTTVWTPPSALNPQSLPDNQSGEAYFWFIRPCKTETDCAPDPLNTDDAATHAFRKLSPSVDLESPADGASVSNQVVFTWDDYLETNEGVRYPNASSPTSQQTGNKYRIQVFTSQADTNPIDDQTVDQTTYTAWANTYPEGDLWWRVQAIDAAGNGLAWSPKRRLVHESPYQNLNAGETLSTGIQGPLDTAIQPAQDARVRGDVELRWTARNYDTAWNVEIYRNDDTTGSPASLVVRSSTTQAAYTWTQQLPASTEAYRWRIQRKDARGRTGPWSDWGRFYVKNSPVTLLQPGEGLRRGDGVLFTWRPVADAANYRLELTGSNGGSNASMLTAATSWAPTSVLPTGSYSWRVKALDASGGVLGVSADWTFRVDQTGPTVKKYGPQGYAKRRANFTATFSEKVTRVSAKTVKVFMEGRRKPLKASIKLRRGRRVVVNPAARLRQGKVYRVLLKPGIRDVAGNSLTAFTWSVTSR